MSNHDPQVTQSPDRERYEAPRVLEDLPLESFSLACSPGKNGPDCDAEGLPITS